MPTENIQKEDVCLVMIVKNEAHVIDRALDSAKPYCAGVIVVDTGSTDGTVEILNGRPDVTVFERPWVDFGHNRTELFDIAKTTTLCPWLLTLDADAVVSGRLPVPFPDTDVLMCDNKLNNIVYPRPTFFRNIGIKWKDPLHEYPDCDGMKVHRNPHSDFTTTHIQDGARSKDPEKFRKDAAVLEAMPVKSNRNTFYLAQSYRDAGDDVNAAHWYSTRVFMGGWAEEVACAQLEYAKCQERRRAARLKVEKEEIPSFFIDHINRRAVADAYFDAWAKRVIRAEPLCELARYHRLNNDFHHGFIYANAAVAIQRPRADVLFIDTTVYEWRSWDELALNAYYIGRKSMAKQIFTHMLDKCTLPPEQKKRTEENLRQCQ
jgi:glycosyltransferase involved in cell wall biosynthesis